MCSLQKHKCSHFAFLRCFSCPKRSDHATSHQFSSVSMFRIAINVIYHADSWMQEKRFPPLPKLCIDSRKNARFLNFFRFQYNLNNDGRVLSPPPPFKEGRWFAVKIRGSNRQKPAKKSRRILYLLSTNITLPHNNTK